MSLVVENLSVFTKHRPIIKNVSLNLLKSSSLAIIGPSGSGKTTLATVILGLFRGFLVTGTISFLSHTIQRDNQLIVPLSARKFGYIPQALALWPHLTVSETLTLGQRFLSKGDATMKAWINELCTRLDLLSLLDAYPLTLSGGEKQRLALARALLVKPRLLVLDEPFSALDTVAKRSLYTSLKDLQQRFSFTTILISHDLEEVLATSSHILVLEAGTVIWHGKTKNLTKDSFSERWNPLNP